MIIDADVHVSPTFEGGNSIKVEDLLKRMEKAKVDKAVTWLQPPYMRKIDKANDYVYEAMRKHPDEILGFGWVDPNLGIEKAKKNVKKYINEYKFYGIKINGAQNNFFIDDPQLSIPIIEEIADTGATLALHVGADAYDCTNPFRVAKIATRFPKLKILMVHMGGVAFDDLTNAAIEVAKDNPNLTLIGSGVRSIPILRAIKTLGSTRVCFGSDTPFELMNVEVARYKALLEDMPENDQYDILAGNIARLLDLDL
ncbi:MAG: amidohydrolase family protein [Candidatus Bathyarchaeia archaeon]